jgi:protein-tyrosine-phosphatase
MRILFVCTGNTCRSVLAQQWLLKLLKERGLDWQVRSAGIAADPFFPIAEEVRAALRERGADGEFRHTPTRLDQVGVEWADLILVMEEIHKAFIDRQFPAVAAKTHLLKAFAGLGGPAEIADPIGGPVEVYRRCLDEVQRALEAVVAKAGTPQ